MEFDADKVDEAVLGLLYLGLHDTSEFGTAQVWKGFDRDVLFRLHEKGLIGDPRSKTKSVLVGAKGIAAMEAAFVKLFGKGG